MLAPGISGHTFAKVPAPKLPRSSFSRTHRYLTTFNSGYLIPAYVDEVLPGDTFNVSANFFARLATPLTPFMDNLYFETFWFFIPNRIVWEHWVNFCGEQANPDSTIDYLIPQTEAPAMGGVAVGDLADYFGLPTGVASLKFNSLALRSYLLTWDYWFRDEDLQDSVFPAVGIGDGPDTYADFPLLQRCKVFDYFTSCRPSPQKGPAVALPLGTTAPVLGLGMDTSSSPSTGPVNVFTTEGTVAFPYFFQSQGSGGAHNFIMQSTSGGQPQMFADLSNAEAATINAIRLAVTTQQFYERAMRGGTRYPELCQAFFGVLNPDSRVQWPEFLSASSTPIKINPVAQTSGSGATGESTPQGNLAAYGVMGGDSQGFTKSFTEHGHILCLVNVRADITYNQGINKMWTRQARFDYYWPDFANIGEQAVLNQEIYCDGSGTDTEVWGYQEPWAEYRYYPSLVTGEYRTTYVDSLDVWHLALNFSSLPTLGSAFIPDDPPIARVVADDDAPQFLLDSMFQVQTARVMPLYGVPGLKRF